MVGAIKFDAISPLEPIKYLYGDFATRHYLAVMTLSNATIKRLAKDDNWHVRCGVAKNEGMTSAIAIALSNDKDHRVRYWVVQNPNTPRSVLKKLSSDDNPVVSTDATVYLNQQTQTAYMIQK